MKEVHSGLEERGIVLGQRNQFFPIMLECWACGEDGFYEVLVVGPGTCVTCSHCETKLIISTLPVEKSDERTRQRELVRGLRRGLQKLLEGKEV